MALADHARRSHDTLFPNHVSTPAATDPELIDVVTQLLPFIGYLWTLNALRAIDEVARNRHT